MILLVNIYHETRVWAANDAIPWCTRGGATAVTSQDVLARSLKVEGSAVEGVVVRISKNCTDTRLCGGEEANDEIRRWLWG